MLFLLRLQHEMVYHLLCPLTYSTYIQLKRRRFETSFGRTSKLQRFPRLVAEGNRDIMIKKTTVKQVRIPYTVRTSYLLLSVLVLVLVSPALSTLSFVRSRSKVIVLPVPKRTHALEELIVHRMYEYMLGKVQVIFAPIRRTPQD